MPMQDSDGEVKHESETLTNKTHGARWRICHDAENSVMGTKAAV